MKKLIFYIFAVLIPLITIAGFNLIVDSNCEINDAFAEKIAGEISLHPLAIHENIPDRVVCLKRIQRNRDKHFNKIVIGSSRILLVGRNINEQVFNLSVSAASLEDVEILKKLIDEYNVTYDTILIGADPWLLNKDNESEEYKTFFPGIDRLSIKSILSWDYFFENLKLNRYNIWDGNDNDLVFFPDGSIRYDIKYRSQKNIDINKINVEQKVYLGNFTSLDSNHLERVIKLFRDFRKGGVTELMLIPYHPEVYKKLSDHWWKFNVVEKAFKDFEAYGINVFGTYNPEKLDYDSSYFYDTIHLTEEGTKELYNSRKNVKKQVKQ